MNFYFDFFSLKPTIMMSNVSVMLRLAYRQMLGKLKRNTIQPVVNQLNDDLFDGNEK
uniref:Uncharacterized protein n=1 Tax=Pithovirus LCPAC304 TaxID=2506594 RepID=A0A481Z818_9VIRU|nr:MAG: hypothetical protein LCPAC304_04050 [Pithovirus LCPAC304]